MTLDILNDIDRLSPQRVLVTGSLPPEGRDIDLLVGSPTERALGKYLAESGWLQRRHQWVTFNLGEVIVLDLVPAETWGLARREIEDLFAEAEPIKPYSNLMRPAPHHFLLHTARRVGEGRATLTDKRRARIEEALARDPQAWEKAESVASAWGASIALEALRHSFDTQTQPARSTKIRARAERKKASGSPMAMVRVLAELGFKRRRGFVVALSGIDGSGKSSQVEEIGTILTKLGYDVTTAWNRLAVDPSLDRFAAPVKKMVRLLSGTSTGEPTEKAAREADPARALRRRAPVVTYGWTAVVATMNGLSHLKATRAMREGRVVVCDRYTLDSSVNLRYLYGIEKRFRAQRWIVRTLSPKPLAAFFLDVSGATAHARKPVKYTPQELQTYADLYREEWQHEGTIRVDGEAAPREITTSIMRALWQRLP